MVNSPPSSAPLANTGPASAIASDSSITAVAQISRMIDVVSRHCDQLDSPPIENWGSG